MRGWEFIDIDRPVAKAALAPVCNTVERQRITLRYLNQLKLQRKRRAAEFAKKQPLIAAMYGDMEQHEAEGTGSRSRRRGIAIGDRDAHAGTGAAEGPDPGQTDAAGIDVE